MKQIFDKQGLADYLKVSVSKVNKLVQLRFIAYRKAGDRVLFSEDDVYEYLDSIKKPMRVYDSFDTGGKTRS